MKMKRKIACMMSVALLLTSPAGVVFASDNGNTGDVWIAEESSVGETIVDCEPETGENLSMESESEKQQNMESETAEPQCVESETEKQLSTESETEKQLNTEPEAYSDEEPDETSLVASVEEIQPDEIPDTALVDSDVVEEAAAIAEETGVSVLESGTWGANLTWTFDSEGTLTISGTGDMDDAYDTEESPWGFLFYYGSYDEENGWTRIQAIVIEEGVTSIGAYVFALDYRFRYGYDDEFGAENAQPVSVTIADSVTDIGEYAFLYSMPDSITLSANVTDIGEGAFETVGTLKEINVSAENPKYCSVNGVLYNKEQTELICCPRGKEGTLIIPDTVTDLGNAAFYGCVGLTSISIPNGITELGEKTFSGCSGLTEVNIPDSVTKLGDYAFSGCRSLTGITIPDGVNEIGIYAFRECSALTEITIPDGVTDIGEGMFSECSDLTKITLPASVTNIGAYAFASCSSLTEMVIPEGVQQIGAWSFYNCSTLKSIMIPTGVESIDVYAFCNCSSLTEITIPEGVTSIGMFAFSDCLMLSEISFPASLTTIDSYLFTGCEQLIAIHVSSENPVYSSQDGVLYDAGKTSLLLYPTAREGNFEIPEGVTSIGAYAFVSCTGLTGVTMPDGLTEIGERAFSSCSELESVTFSKTVTSIGDYAFAECGKLAEIRLPDSVTEMGQHVFYDCDGLKSVTLSAGLKCTGEHVFYDCNNLSEVVIPSGITTIGRGAFECCGSLLTISLPDTVTTIEEDAFTGSGLTEVTIPGSVTEIGNSAFRSCGNLKWIALSRNLKTIGGLAFSGCGKLTDVYYEGTKAGWKALVSAGTDGGLNNVVFHYNSQAPTSALSSCLISSLENTADGVAIKWNEVSEADGYYIYRKTASGKYKKIKTIKKSSTVAYTDKAVKNSNGVTYLYKVLPYLNGTKGTGKAQTIVRLTGTTITKVTNTASGKVKIKWTSVADVTGYQIKCKGVRKKISGATKKSVTLTNSDVFIKGEKCTAYIRTYVKVDGVIYYSAWSSKVTITLTK